MLEMESFHASMGTIRCYQVRRKLSGRLRAADSETEGD